MTGIDDTTTQHDQALEAVESTESAADDYPTGMLASPTRTRL